MSQHVPEDLLVAFTDGDVGEQLAIHIAEHLDSCPACSTRATGLDPLASAFAAMVDPEVPEDLSESVLDILAAPEPTPRTEIALGCVLLTAAAIAAALLGSPTALAAEFGVVLKAVGTLMGALLTGIGASSTAALVLATLVAFAGCVGTARFAMPTPVGARRLP